jgi:hypothetical protein
MNNIEMTNNSNFIKGDERFVKKGREGNVNGSQWRNTKQYWARGTNSKSRTSSGRGTHKVFKSRANEIKKAHSKEQKEKLKEQKEKLKAEINTLQQQLAEVGFVQNPSERLRIRNSNGSFSYATQLRTGLSHNELAAIEKKYEEANTVNAELAGMMGNLGVGGKRKTRKHKSCKRKTHKRKTHKRKTHKRKTRRHH